MAAACVATEARPTPLVVRPPPPTMAVLAPPTPASYLRRCDGGKDVEVSSVWLLHRRAVGGAQLSCRAGLWLFFSFLENVLSCVLGEAHDKDWGLCHALYREAHDKDMPTLFLSPCH
jgi:hypothetical protein